MASHAKGEGFNSLLSQCTKKFAKLTINDQPQPEFKQHSIRRHPYQRPTAENTRFTIYAEKGANIYTSSKENPSIIIVQSASKNER